MSDYLLDGATLLAAMGAPFRLRSEAHAILTDRANTIYVTAATFLDAYALEQDERADFPALRGRLQSAATQLGFVALDTTPAHVDRAPPRDHRRARVYARGNSRHIFSKLILAENFAKLPFLR